MKPADARKLAAAIRASDHRYLGIRPADATPPEAPAAILDGRTMGDLARALDLATDYWTTAANWTLIGTDQLLQLSDAAWPPTFQAPRTPSILATFTTAG